MQEASLDQDVYHECQGNKRNIVFFPLEAANFFVKEITHQNLMKYIAQVKDNNEGCQRPEKKVFAQMFLVCI